MSNLYYTHIKLKVDWADLDLFGHVNNVVFFKYIQSARVNYCELIGLTSLNNSDKLSFMVASSQCQFKKPLRYPDEIHVFCKVDWIKNSSFQLSYQIHNSENIVIAEAADILVVYNHLQHCSFKMPESVRETVQRIEKRVF